MMMITKKCIECLNVIKELTPLSCPICLEELCEKCYNKHLLHGCSKSELEITQDLCSNEANQGRKRTVETRTWHIQLNSTREDINNETKQCKQKNNYEKDLQL
jgi:hypothetical protein